MSNDTIVIVTVCASFIAGVAVTLFTIKTRYLLKHRPRFSRMDRVRINAFRNSLKR